MADQPENEKTFFTLLHHPKIDKVLKPLKLAPRSNIEFMVAELIINKLAQRAYPELDGIDTFEGAMTTRLYRELGKLKVEDNAAKLIHERIDKAVCEVVAEHFGDKSRFH